MSTQNVNSPTQEDLPKEHEEEEEEEIKQNPENPQEQPKEEPKEDMKMALLLWIPLRNAVLRLLRDPGVLSASGDAKEDTSALGTNIHSSTTTLPLKNLPFAYASSSSTPSLDSAKSPKRPFSDTGNDEDESQGNEKKKKEEEAHGGDAKDEKPKEEDPLEPDLVRLSSGIDTEIEFLNGLLDYQSENVMSLQDFMKNRLKADVFPKDLGEEIKKLQEKYEKTAAEIVGNLKAMEPEDREAFYSAHTIWGTESETEFVKESMSILEAENILLKAFALYYIEKGSHPFDSPEGMDDFIRNWIRIDLPAGKFVQMIQGLRRKYEEKKGMMHKNVGLLGARDREAFDLAKKIWGKGNTSGN